MGYFAVEVCLGSTGGIDVVRLHVQGFDFFLNLAKWPMRINLIEQSCVF